MSSTVVFHLPYLRGECVTCDFDVSFDLKPNTFGVLEVLSMFRHPEEQGNPFCVRNCERLCRNPPEYNKAAQNVLTAVSNPLCVWKILLIISYHWGEDTRIQTCAIGNGSLLFSPHTAAGLRYGSSRRHLTSRCVCVYVLQEREREGSDLHTEDQLFLIIGLSASASSSWICVLCRSILTEELCYYADTLRAFSAFPLHLVYSICGVGPFKLMH